MNGCSFLTTLCLGIIVASSPSASGAEPASASKNKADEAPKTVSQSLPSQTEPASGANSKHRLRYQFVKDQTLRWEVVHQSAVHTNASGNTQVAETVSKSTKVWKVTDVAADGTATFVHSVDDVDMRHKLTGRDEVRYNSRVDKTPPAGFQNVCEAVGVPLTTVKIDPQGNILRRERKQLKAAAKSEGQITIPLPAEPVAIGESWSFPYDTEVSMPKGMVKKIKLLQKFTLRSVSTGVATIEVTTQVLTPVHDPAIEAQLIQATASGTVKFDIDAGRVLQQQMDVDKRVVGFRGEATSIHYLTRFTEKLLPDTDRTAQRTPAPSK